MKNVLLLNADWSPLNFVSSFRALNLLFKGRAEVIFMSDRPSMWDEKVSTATRSFDVPATVRLVERVNRKYSTPRFRKWVLFNRDDWQCQYCGTSLDFRSVTIDHVTPRSRGGATTWKNCVTSCRKCNWNKGSKTLAEAGMHLRKNPADPKLTHFWEVRHQSVWHPDWSSFLDVDSYKT